METMDVIGELRDLIQLDMDAIRAYDQAIEATDNASVKQHMQTYRHDHERHVADLSTEVRKLGGVPPENTPDMKGYIIQGFTAIRSVTGTEGALNAMETNERLTNTTYKNAVAKKFPAGIQRILEAGYRDEERHLAWIQQAIQKRVWEQVPAH